MILTVHAVAAAAISTQFKNKYIGWSMALLSHFILDYIPHFEYSLENKLFPLFFFIDLLAGFIFIIIFTRNKNNLFRNLMAGVIGISPDGLTLLYIIFNNYPSLQVGILGQFLKILKEFYLKFHYLLHAKKPGGIIWGGFIQFFILIFSIFSIKHRK